MSPKKTTPTPLGALLPLGRFETNYLAGGDHVPPRPPLIARPLDIKMGAFLWASIFSPRTELHPSIDLYTQPDQGLFRQAREQTLGTKKLLTKRKQLTFTLNPFIEEKL